MKKSLHLIRDKETYEKCWKCRSKKPCILNCQYQWEIIDGKHYIKGGQYGIK